MPAMRVVVGAWVQGVSLLAITYHVQSFRSKNSSTSQEILRGLSVSFHAAALRECDFAELSCTFTR